MREAASPTRLVLAGVGHANLEVLRRFSSRGLAGVDLTVISPGPLHLYSGMVPGYLRGTYRVEEIAVDVAPLVRAAGGRVLLGRAVGLDPGRRQVRVVEAADDGATSAADGGVVVGGGIREVPYDLVAFAVGSDAVGAAAASARGGGAVLSCKPIGRAIELRRRLDLLAGEGHPPATVAVVGGGAAGVEIALAAAGRLGSSAAGRLGSSARGRLAASAASGLSASAVGGRGTSAARHRVLLLEAGPAILADRSPRLRRRAEEVLQRRGVELRTGSKVVEVNPPGEAAGPPGRAVLRLSGGEEISCNLVIWVTAATGWPLFREAGLPLDDRGFLLVDGALRSVADPRVFAAGDCATLAAFPGTAKAGVYAVREGPVLARALRAALAGEQPPRYRPQRGFLVILNTGDGRALLSYKGFVSYSRWAFRLKDRIDRGFVAKYRPRRQEESTGEERRGGSSGGI
ncbi:MAG TPA: FAD-dependent oxidoreductase [Thermoanaerobaculia bacterium]|nr:FAD-dependent oxidoreductase [Thermoanaerobaculia bacterium]